MARLKKRLLDYLKTSYFEKGHPLYYSALNNINYIFDRSLPVEDINDFLERQRSHTVFKNTRKGAINPIYKYFKRQNFQIDLLEIRNISKENKSFNYLLTIIDSYTKFAWAIPLDNKKASTVLNAFKSVIESLEEKPLNVISDLGKEFKNEAFKKYCDDHYMTLSHPYTHTHAGIIERFHRTLHRLIWPPMTNTGSRNFVTYLDAILKSYNTRPHRMLGMKSPKFAEEHPTNAYIATKNQEYLDSKKSKKPRKPKYKVGNRVRVRRLGDAFWRGYDGSFNEEVYEITHVKTTLDVPLFKLKTLKGEELLGHYYGHELSRVRGNPEYLIEQVLDTRGDQSLVKFVGFKKPEWISTTDIIDLTQ